MLKNFDHLTIVVHDLARAKEFFAILGFKEAKSVVISGEPFASYMGVPGITADHVTLVLENVSPRTEIQLLRYRHPEPLPDPHVRDHSGRTQAPLRALREGVALWWKGDRDESRLAEEVFRPRRKAERKHIA
jgi:catechol 2,3-dioxygenase-like lactoylglutathione lyase family enzyme